MDVLPLIEKEGLRRGLSDRTIVTYCHCVKKFLINCKKDPKDITKGDIRDFMDFLIGRGVAGNTLNVYLGALKFLFEEILSRKLLLFFKYSKAPRELPSVLTKEEIVQLFFAIRNKKHSLMIRLMYSTGLRVSELARLKVKDFEFEHNYGWVRKGKGNKDRLFVLAHSLKEELISFIRENKVDYKAWLFGGRKGRHIHPMSLHNIVKQAAKRAGIKKNVHCHTLRHSFATHLIEDGYSVGDVQSLLGHSSPDSTMRYVHMASPKMLNIKSPYETLQQSS